mgnify:FL=1
MKKILSLLTALLITGIMTAVNAATTPEQVLSFFNNYVSAANSYSDTITSFYAPDAKIIRVVMKPDGTTATVTADTKQYFNQMRIGANLAKINKYKNFYTERKITKQGNDYKITCKRQPSTSDYKIPAHFVIGPDASGKLKIKEEMMYTKQQKFLKYAK